MIARLYQFQFFLNARHTLTIEGKTSTHPHTWEIGLSVVKESEEFIQFNHLENVIHEHLKHYESKTLNHIPPFDAMPPTLEIIGEVLYEQLNYILSDLNWKISSLEISETSARKYAIRDVAYRFRGYNPIDHLHDDTYRLMINGSNERGVKKPNFIERSITKAEPQIVLQNEKSENETISILKEELELLKSQMHLQNELNANQAESLMLKQAQMETKLEDVTLYKMASLENQYLGGDSEHIACRLEIDEQTHEEDGVASQAASVCAEAGCFQDAVGLTNEKVSVDLKAVETVSRISLSERLSKGIKFFKLNPSFMVALMLIVSFVSIYLWITRDGYCPWGSDTWGHLFKAHFLYTSVMDGNFFPQYTDLWYNGIQPFRYWAPVPYYILLFGELVTGGNTLASYYVFVGLVFFVSAIPFILYGKKKGHVYLGTILGILYFILPDNYRLLLAEGNLPRVVVSIFFPYLVWAVLLYLEKRSNKILISVFFLMLCITLSHAMIAALVGITLFLFLLIRFIVMKQKFFESAYLLASAVCGIFLSGIWLYPALKGGIVSIDSSSVMETLTYSIAQLLNPYYRVSSHPDAFYFGLSIFLIIIIGLLASKGQAKASFILVLIIFLGTTKWFLFALKKLPMSELFWMMRFTPLAMVFFLMALLDWSGLKKKVLYLFIGIVLADCIFTMAVLKTSLPIYRALESIEYASQIATQRVAMIDLSTYDSDPSYHISFNSEGRHLPQVFGWAWQGASTATNIVQINESFVKGYYAFMFDRLLELGSDTVIVKKMYVEDHKRLIEVGEKSGFRLHKDMRDDYVFKYEVDFEFATKVDYKNIAIGKFSDNIVLAFPQFVTGQNDYLDSYTFEALKSYEKIVLSGFKYKNKADAESLVQKLSEAGVEIFIDMTGQTGDMYSMRPEFMGVIAQTLNIKGAYPALHLKGKNYILANFKEDTYQFNTSYMTNLDAEFGVTTVDQQDVPFFGYKGNENIKFVGLNLFYYLYSNRDEAGLDLMSELMGLEAEGLPPRQVVKVKTVYNSNKLEISAEPGTLMPMAKLDVFKSKQSIDEINNLSLLVEGNTTIEIVYPYIGTSVWISVFGLAAFVVLLLAKETFERIIISFVTKVKGFMTEVL